MAEGGRAPGRSRSEAEATARRPWGDSAAFQPGLGVLQAVAGPVDLQDVDPVCQAVSRGI